MFSFYQLIRIASMVAPEYEWGGSKTSLAPTVCSHTIISTLPPSSSLSWKSSLRSQRRVFLQKIGGNGLGLTPPPPKWKKNQPTKKWLIPLKIVFSTNAMFQCLLLRFNAAALFQLFVAPINNQHDSVCPPKKEKIKEKRLNIGERKKKRLVEEKGSCSWALLQLVENNLSKCLD